MFRLKPRPGERGENWMLKKVDDAFAGSPTGLTDTYLTSVKTGRTMDEIAAGKKAKEIPPRDGEGTARSAVEGAPSLAPPPLHHDAPRRGPPPRPGEEPGSPSSASRRRRPWSTRCRRAARGCTR